MTSVISLKSVPSPFVRNWWQICCIQVVPVLWKVVMITSSVRGLKFFDMVTLSVGEGGCAEQQQQHRGVGSVSVFTTK